MSPPPLPRSLVALLATGLMACSPAATARPSPRATPRPTAPADPETLALHVARRPTPGWLRATLHVAAGPLEANPPALATLAADLLAPELEVESAGPLVRFRVHGDVETLPELLALLARVLSPEAEEALEPTFEAGRQALLAARQAAWASPPRRAETLAGAGALGAGADPHGGSFEALELSSLRAFVRARYRAGAAHLTLEGDLDHDEARRAVRAAFRSARPGAPVPLPAPPPSDAVSLQLERASLGAAALAFTVPPERLGGAADALRAAGAAQVRGLPLPGAALVLGRVPPHRLEAALAVAARPPAAFARRRDPPAVDASDALALASWAGRASRTIPVGRVGLGVLCTDGPRAERCEAEARALLGRERARRAQAAGLVEQARERARVAGTTDRGARLVLETTTHADVGLALTLEAPEDARGTWAGAGRLVAGVLREGCPGVRAASSPGRLTLLARAPTEEAAQAAAALLDCATTPLAPERVAIARRQALLTLRADPLGVFLGEGFGETELAGALGLSVDQVVDADARGLLRRLRARGRVTLRVVGPFDARGRAAIAATALPTLQRLGGSAERAERPPLALPRGLRAVVGEARLAVVAHAEAAPEDELIAGAFAAALEEALRRRGARPLARRAGTHAGGVHAAVLLAPDAQPLETLVAALPAALGEARRRVAEAWTPARRRRWLAERQRHAATYLGATAPDEDIAGLLRELAAQPAVLVARPRRR